MTKTRPAGVTSTEIAQSNLSIFKAWATGKSDADFRDMVVRGGVSRTEISRECGFAKSVLTQNKLVARELRKLEDGLRDRGVLPRLAASAAGDGGTIVIKTAPASAVMLERLSRLEQENAALRAETRELRGQLSRFVVLREALEATGRIPR